MDPFTSLHYHYPGATSAQQPRGSVHRTVHQTSPGAFSEPSRMALARTSFDPSAPCSSHPQQKSSVGPRGVSRSGPTGPMRTYYVDEPQAADLTDRYIPSSSDRITCADHRPLDVIFGNTSSSSERPHAKSGSIYQSHNESLRGLPRRTSVITYPLPARPQMEGVVHIPLLAVDNQMEGSGHVIDFRCSDWGIGVQIEGIPMSDLLHGNTSALESPHQRVFDGSNLTDLRLNILWPHYPPFSKAISAFGMDGKPITRAELGYEASLAFAEFFYQITSRSIRPAKPGPYAVSVLAGSPSPGIKFEQLHLITVRNTSHGEWMAEIRAVSAL